MHSIAFAISCMYENSLSSFKTLSPDSQGQTAFHLGDLLPTHAHFNPLWVMAYDDFPLDVIRLKELWQKQAKEENAWYLFYHDPFVQYRKFDDEGNVIESSSQGKP